MIVDYNCVAVYTARNRETRGACGPFTFASQLGPKYNFELKINDENGYHLNFKNDKHEAYFLLKFE